ncbi:MAG: tRNA (N6-isopentenyl adenosine(37)-C2)-methylthiotransferase MiaB [Anaerohalosphaeraceae bacterium]|nr:tRNA (N6-isopentenyl adenosine(37)-C2)-methylthiotransferase MiaB [Anaerohalosphaeraceae bacterium]
MNKLDSNLVENAFASAGYKLTDTASEADAVLINTCSVRGGAEERVFSLLGQLKHIKESRPEIVVAVFGCMAQRLGAELLNHEAVNIVCAPAQIPQLVDMVADTLESKVGSIAVTENIRSRPQPELSERLDDFELAYDRPQERLPSQAFVRIMRGCNNFCTYCIVPYVRGPETSRPPSAIIAQIKKLAASGVKQVTLLGQTVNSYRYETGENSYGLAELLEMVSEIDGIEWIRFVTGHPKDFDEKIFRAMAKLPKVCPYLHVPAQSGSDRILKAMNRGYTSSDYISLIEKAKAIVPGIAIAGDFIVGFPGETDEDFATTVELVKKVEYKNCFVFKYSPRPGTRADEKLGDTVPAEIKKQRNIELLAVQEKISLKLNEALVGAKVKVLVEGLSKKSHLNRAENSGLPQLIARTATDRIVVFNGHIELAGRFCHVQITKVSALTLFGELLDRLTRII